MYERRSIYGVKAVAVMRNNPDGTNPSATGGFLGFAGTADLSAVLTSSAANLTIKIDDGTAETKSVSFADAVSESAVTVEEAVTALTTSAFTGITWSAGTDKDGITRLKGVAASGTFVQVTGDLAADLDFGQGIEFPNNGLEIYTYLSTTGLVSADTSLDITDASKQTVEGSEGNQRNMNIPAKLNGISCALTVYQDSYAIAAAIEGGKFDRTNDTYESPMSDQVKYPSVCVLKYDGQYNKDSNNIGDYDSVQIRRIYNCNGLRGDDTDENGWKEKVFNLTGVDYTDADGVKHPSYIDERISASAFDALGIDKLMEETA